LENAYLAGEQAGKRGRGSLNNTPFVAAVETQDGWLTKIKLRRVSGFRKDYIKCYAENSIYPDSIVYSHGLRCFSALEDYGCNHIPVVTSGGRPKAYLFASKWVNTILDYVKKALPEPHFISTMKNYR
jgi:hypothetical protein